MNAGRLPAALADQDIPPMERLRGRVAGELDLDTPAANALDLLAGKTVPERFLAVPPAA